MPMKSIGGLMRQKSPEIEKMLRKRNMNSFFVGRYEEKPVLFNPGLGRISGSATAGLFLSQMLYWYQRGWNKEWMYKTIKEFKGETCLSRSEQDRAIRKWSELGILEVKRKSIPRKRFFRVDIEKLDELLREEFEKRKAESDK